MKSVFSKASGQIAKRIFALLMLALISACSSKVVVVSEIPRPLVEKVPLNVHLSFSDEFTSYVYVENEKKRALSSMDFAQAQSDMFQAIFSDLTNLVEHDSVDKDITVEPEVLSFEYSAPRETSLKQYEVSLRYRIKLLNNDGSKLADWVVKGFGKTPTALLTNAAQAFNSATNVALRDVGAQLAIYFPGQSKVKAIIDGKTDGASGIKEGASGLDLTSGSDQNQDLELEPGLSEASKAENTVSKVSENKSGGSDE